MKLKLRLTRNSEEKVKEELMKNGIEISEESDFILTEENYKSTHFICKDDSEYVFLDLGTIVSPMEYRRSLGYVK